MINILHIYIYDVKELVGTWGRGQVGHTRSGLLPGKYQEHYLLSQNSLEPSQVGGYPSGLGVRDREPQAVPCSQ